MATNEMGRNSASSDEIIIGRKSWICYVAPLVLYIIASLYLFNFGYDFEKYRYIIFTIFSILIVYRLAVLRSYRLAVDPEGIWLLSGVFPWTYSSSGIRWRDADMAVYHANFSSWITNSYTIGLQHRFTNKSDFIATDIWGGRQACSVIYGVQKELLMSDVGGRSQRT